jgi:hypothetical protein
MTIATARNVCCLIIGCCLSLGVLVGAFLKLTWPPLALMSWLSLTLFGRRTMIESTIRLIREVRGLWLGKKD